MKRYFGFFGLFLSAVGLGLLIMSGDVLVLVMDHWLALLGFGVFVTGLDIWNRHYRTMSGDSRRSFWKIYLGAAVIVFLALGIWLYFSVLVYALD